MNSREKMIGEIKSRYDLDSPSVFSAMLQIPREKFVSGEAKHRAYKDSPISIGHSQTMSQPYTVAFMTDLLDLKGGEKVLEIGTGSGYQAAVLSLLSKEVYSVEIIEELAKEAKDKLSKLGYGNVHVKQGRGEVGWPKEAPFDAIMVTAGLEKKVPEALLAQLKIDGVLLAPIGTGDKKLMTKYIKKENGAIKKEEHGIFYFVPFVMK